MKKQIYTTFYIVRHGETDWNVAGKLQGQSDIPLNADGVKQATKLAKELAIIPFDFAYSSDLLRARYTTKIIALEKKIVVTTTELLRERNYGEYEGMVFKLTELFDKLTKDLSHQEKLQFKITPNIESDEELISRLFRFIKECALSHPQKTVLIGTHGGVIGNILLHLGYFTYENRKQYRMGNAGYIILRTDGIEFFIDDVIGIEKRT